LLKRDVDHPGHGHFPICIGILNNLFSDRSYIAFAEEK
jgi:hypothetical protein